MTLEVKESITAGTPHLCINVSYFLLESWRGLIFHKAVGSGKHCSAPIAVMLLLPRCRLCFSRHHHLVMITGMADIGGLGGGWGSSEHTKIISMQQN